MPQQPETAAIQLIVDYGEFVRRLNRARKLVQDMADLINADNRARRRHVRRLRRNGKPTMGLK